MLKQRTNLRLLLSALAMVILIGGILYIFRSDIKALADVMKSDQTPPLLVVLSFLVLPVVFFPITILLVVVGIRFEMGWGLLIMMLAMPFHLLFSYWVTHSFLRKRIERFARQRNEFVLNVPKHRQVTFGLMFMAVPGLPYAVKNYLLPLSGMDLKKYLLISWAVQGAMGIPFVILGDAASRFSIPLFIGFALLFIVAFMISRKIKRRLAARYGGDKN